MAIYKAGDTMRLKSGGPTMTIREINENGKPYCEWFTSDNKMVMGKSFPPPEALEPVSPEDV
jgi:uncharacterized protein YodC (DUF2158 family)